MTQMQAPEPGSAAGVREATSPDPDQMRAAMGTFASGVTVVTGIEADEPVGFACQSFASVSLDPPLVLFCADHRGRTWPRIRRSGRFTVNVLSEGQRDLCTRFGSSRGARFDGLAWIRSAWDTPSLPDVLLRVHAEVYDVRVAGDHDVVIGRVLGLESGGWERPMIFYQGGFGLDRRGERAFSPELAAWAHGDR